MKSSIQVLFHQDGPIFWPILMKFVKNVKNNYFEKKSFVLHSSAEKDFVKHALWMKLVSMRINVYIIYIRMWDDPKWRSMILFRSNNPV